MLRWLIDIITRPSHEDRVIEIITKRKIIRDDFKTPTEWYADRGTLTRLEDIGNALGIDKRNVGKYLERGLAKIRHIIFKNPHKYRDLLEHIHRKS